MTIIIILTVDVGFVSGTNTHKNTENKVFFMVRCIGEAPPKLSQHSVPWPVPRLHPRHTENTSSVREVLPTTAAAKEREGKPSYGQQPKIDPIYTNQATHLGLLYKNIVYTQSWCLPKAYLWTEWTTDILYLNELSSVTSCLLSLLLKQTHNPFWIVNIQSVVSVFDYSTWTSHLRDTRWFIPKTATANYNNNWKIVSIVALCRIRGRVLFAGMYFLPLLKISTHISGKTRQKPYNCRGRWVENTSKQGVID